MSSNSIRAGGVVQSDCFALRAASAACTDALSFHLFFLQHQNIGKPHPENLSSFSCTPLDLSRIREKQITGTAKFALYTPPSTPESPYEVCMLIRALTPPSTRHTPLRPPTSLFRRKHSLQTIRGFRLHHSITSIISSRCLWPRRHNSPLRRRASCISLTISVLRFAWSMPRCLVRRVNTPWLIHMAGHSGTRTHPCSNI